MKEKKKYTDKEFIDIVASSTSIRQVLSQIGLRPAGGNYQTVKQKIAKLHLDTSHFLGKGSNLGREFGPRRELSDYLENKFPIHSHKLRKRLIREGVFEHKCYNCGLSQWLGKDIPLELEHIDGDHHNNDLANLTLLCPNCHAQTPTYRGRNINH